MQDKVYPHVPVHELIAEQIRVRPDSVAVSDAERSWTYRELSENADRLLDALPDHIGRGDVVGVHVSRTVAAAAAVLAVLRSGAAYAPLEPTYPLDRLRFVAQDAKFAAVISDDPEIAARLCPVVVSTVDVPRGPRREVADVRPDDAAYVIYTSGSTGQPKGAVSAHRGVANIVGYAREHFGFAPTDSVLAMASFAFDFAALELLLPLASGGTLHLLDRAVARDPGALSTALRQRSVSYLMGTPSMFAAMLGAGWEPPSTLTVVAGGEVLPRALADRLAMVEATWNIYGPTETTIFSTCERVAADGDVTIGRPVSGTVVHLLDGVAPVTDGEVGEICVGGVGVGLGYLNRPQLTAQRFVDDPTGGDSPVYRTGDLGRLRPDGRIEYVGRADDQVKIRGFRVELGGIEAVLHEHPAVTEAAVVVHDGPVLAAHVVARPDVENLDATLRGYLRGRLPAHEVPHRIVVLPRLPRNGNDKIDRQALRLSPVSHGAPADSGLLGIWRDVLGRQDVQPTDDFFDMGGDSLTVLRLVTRATAAGLPISVSDVYRNPTVAGLAAVDGTTAAEPVTETEAPALLPSQHWFFDLEHPDPSHFVEPVVFAVRERLDRHTLTRSLVELTVRHAVLRSRFTPDHGGVTLAEPDASFPLSWLDSTGLDKERAESAYREAVDGLYHRFDIESGPVCHALYAASDHGDRLVLAFQHLVIDGVSVQTLAQEMDLRYRGDPVTAPPVSAFGHAAALRRSTLGSSGARMAREWLSFPWQEVGQLPAETPEGGLARSEMASFALLCEEPLSKDVLALAQHSATSTEQVMLAGVAAGTAGFCDSDTVAIDVFRHGRGPLPGGPDLTRTVGWLAGVVPHVLTVPRQAGPAGVVSALRQQLLHVRDVEQAWGPLRYLSEDTEWAPRFAALPRPQVYVHYRGRGLHDLPTSDLFTRTDDYVGQGKSAESRTFAQIEVRIDIVDERLSFDWSYSPRMFAEQEVRDLATASLGHLELFTRTVLAD